MQTEVVDNADAITAPQSEPPVKKYTDGFFRFMTDEDCALYLEQVDTYNRYKKEMRKQKRKRNKMLKEKFGMNYSRHKFLTDFPLC
ncbi:MAG: hypothetical protein ABSC53_05250 [Bacteroidota bacterium]|jgi:hypothetical protein